MTYAGSLPQALQDQGFAILCGTCPQYLNIKFDATTTETKYDPQPSNSNDLAREFIIGVANVTSVKDLPKAIFDGIASTPRNVPESLDQDTSDNVLIDEWAHQVRIAKDPADHSKYLILKDDSYLQFLDSGTLMEYDVSNTKFNPLTVHYGTRANQRINFYINNMHSEALGINRAEVTTRQKATSAISIIDSAITYSLSEATYIGAYLQRLEYTESNVVTMDENTQGAESTIRDADMAKEMTDYTKWNVLTQSAQAMLAQANQNLSGVLSLLQ